MSPKDLILGIEAAVAGGTLSVFRGKERLANWSGVDEPMRAEDVLIRIKDLLHRSGAKKSDITKIVVSAGPGSFTGIRVGIATALGIKDALQIEVSSFSVLEAMAATVDLTGTAAIPMGRGAACAQGFVNGTAASEPFNTAIEHLPAKAEGVLLLHAGLSESVAQEDRVRLFGDDLATALIRMSVIAAPRFAPPIFISRVA